MGGATRVGFGLALVAVACASAERREQVGPDPSDPVATATATAASPAFELAAGVVIDPSSQAIYLARAEGGIEALDPASGHLRWISNEASTPLFARHGRLLAQREVGIGLPLAILATSDGGLRRRLEVPLPEGVRAAVDESLENSFVATVRAAGDSGDEAIVEWEYLERDVLGVSPKARNQSG